MAPPACWMLLACAGVGACTQDYLQIAIETEVVPSGRTYPVGAGLTVGVSVYHVTDGFGDEDPNADDVTVTSLAVRGGTQVACGDYPACILVDGAAGTLAITATTPNGNVTTSREIVTNTSLASSAWGWWPTTALQLPANTSVPGALSFMTGATRVSGHVDSYTTTGPVSISGDMIVTGDLGDAAIAPAGVPGVTPLALRVVTPAQSVASIARFTVNRELDGGDTMLNVDVDPVHSAPIEQSRFYIDGFDADGYLALPDLAVAASGPYLAATGLTGGSCSTIEPCFPHASLPDGALDVETDVELVAGSADQRIPVHIAPASSN